MSAVHERHAARPVDRFYCRLIGVLVDQAADRRSRRRLPGRHYRHAVINDARRAGRGLPCPRRAINLCGKTWGRRRGLRVRVTRWGRTAEKSGRARRAGRLTCLATDRRLSAGVNRRQRGKQAETTASEDSELRRDHTL